MPIACAGLSACSAKLRAAASTKIGLAMRLLASWPRACHDFKEQVHGKADAEVETEAEVEMVAEAGG